MHIRHKYDLGSQEPYGEFLPLATARDLWRQFQNQQMPEIEWINGTSVLYVLTTAPPPPTPARRV
jgi:hypothetical protein